MTRAVLARLSVLALLLAIGSLGCQSVRVALDREWIEVTSRHFTITSCIGGDETVELAERLEIFRAAVLVLTNVETLESNVPTRIFVFDGRGSYHPFSPGRDVLGYFVPSMRANFVTILDDRRVDAGAVIKHEYTHFLIRNGSKLVYPHWYDEGFAEVMSTVGVDGEHVIVGRPPDERLKSFRHGRWVPMDRIIRSTGTQNWTPHDTAMSYAQSWALIYYLLRDAESRNAFPASMEAYLSLVAEGTGAEDAFESAFGLSMSKLDRVLIRFLEHGSFAGFGFRADQLRYPRETQVRPLPRAEVSERLGELALAIGALDAARSLFEQAIAADPALARAQAGMGDTYKFAGDFQMAEPHFARAVDLDPDDPLNQLDFGEYWAARADETQDPAQRHEFLRRARRHYVRAYQLDDTLPEPYGVYGATFLVEGEDATRGIETLEHAERLLPSNAQIQLMLAEGYVAVGRAAEARVLLGRILAGAHGSGANARARALLEELEEAPVVEQATSEH